MLDKILGKTDKSKNNHVLRKKVDKDSGADVSDHIKNMVIKATNGPKDQIDKINSKLAGDNDKGDKRKIPRSMPKPHPSDTGKARLKVPSDKPPEKKPNGIGEILPGFGRRTPNDGGRGNGPDDDRRTLIGALVFGIIIIILVGAGYYFLVYSPYQTSLSDAKQVKFNQVNAYYTGGLTADPEKQTLLAEINGATTPDQVAAIDVNGPATTSWRIYQNQQISTKKDAYSRVQVAYSDQGNQKNLLMNILAAQQIVNQSNATVLSNMVISAPDTVAIPLMLSRLQAAGGVINVGDNVDIYFTSNGTTTGTATNQTNQTNQTSQTSTSTNNNSNPSPQVSGSTVLAILRSQNDGSNIQANLTVSQAIAANQLSASASATKSSTTNVEQLLQAASANVWDPSSVSSLLSSYGYRLDDFERTSNMGDLNAQYMVILEVPRGSAVSVLQNSNSIQLVIPTQSAPTWIITELHKVYG